MCLGTRNAGAFFAKLTIVASRVPRKITPMVMYQACSKADDNDLEIHWIS